MARSRGGERLAARRSPSAVEEGAQRARAACAPSSAMSLLAELHRERLGPEAPALARVARARDAGSGRARRRRWRLRSRRDRRRSLVVATVVAVEARLEPRDDAVVRVASSCRACPSRRCRRGSPCAAPRGAPATATSGSTPSASTARASSVGERDRAAPAPRERRRPRAACAADRRRRARDRRTVRAPRPSHAGHAPCGPLNENMRGSIGGSEMPQSMQAKRSLIQNGSLVASSTVDEQAPLAELERELDAVGERGP